MLTVYMTKGLPGSGKSTWANNMVRNQPAFKRVSVDDLRTMMSANRKRDNDEFLLKVRDSIILLALESGNNVIVDDTNLDPIHEARIRNLIKDKARLIIEDFTIISLKECISNDLNRCRSVGESVIKEMYEKWIK